MASPERFFNQLKKVLHPNQTDKQPQKEFDPVLLRKKLIEIRTSADKYANHYPSDYIGENGRPSLPNPLILQNNTTTLISDAHLGGNKMFPEPEKRQYPEVGDQLGIDQYLFQNSDRLSLPVGFIAIEDAFYLLFVPSFGQVPTQSEPRKQRLGNTGYDVTVAYRHANNLYRLPSIGEILCLEGHEEFYMDGDYPNYKKAPLPHPKENPIDHDPELEIIPIPNEGSVAFWEGRNTRGWLHGGYDGPNWVQDKPNTDPGNPDDHRQIIEKEFPGFYKLIVNGTVCYRMREGIIQKRATEKFSSSHATEPILTGA